MGRSAADCATTARHALEMLPLLACDAILILSDHGQSGDPTHADSLALAALMLTRDIQRRWCHDPTTTLPPLAEGIPLELASDRRPRLDDANPTSAGGASPSHWHTLRQSHRSGRRRRASRELNSECTVVTELRDISLQRNVRASGLAEGDFVASNELVSPILNTLLESTGPSLLIHPSTKYVKDGRCCSFLKLASKALAYGEIAIGYLVDGKTLVLNPRDKAEKLINWHHGDTVAVIAMLPPSGTKTSAEARW
ncbi:hypothetical protein EMIHUDRAFT_103399 [Emiliania huxleyi CCMP1516]|uniref:Uncharacterized protein n=2 Tax=Emiliania huxleyi TaxID=2903 RepID=A0A0D3ISS4_EMIH1|nr:hypothetical protein EMIHUDRAFT_103399 [Emiliania huxleyi CCMP1516]EOD14309.1 hypothetical protein EMIHUDRAFT_103399 [Emiliania huxleyi CCMP1516]|eukprot:XP_005766738.1 hypothetical protein EMIHUDRAFT_103399 [Emiliania huxleyi CCMP1516]